MFILISSLPLFWGNFTQERIISVSQGGKFQKKLWRCVGGEFYKIIQFINSFDNVNWPPQRESKADVSRVCVCIRSDEGLTLETSPLESLYGGQFILSTQLSTLGARYTYRHRLVSSAFYPGALYTFTWIF